MVIDRELAKSYINGDIGEAITANTLREKGFRVLRNLYIPIDGYETEVDIVAISEYGVYVVENKNYHAKVQGSLKHKYWLCKYYFDYEELLYNPVEQNKKHVNAIKALLQDIRDIKIPCYNVVIFNDLTKLEIKGFNGNAFILSDFIKKYDTITPVRKKKVLNYETIDIVYDTLYEYSDTSFTRKCDFVIGLSDDKGLHKV